MGALRQPYFKVFCIILLIAFLTTWMYFKLPLYSNIWGGSLFENCQWKNNYLQSIDSCCCSGAATSHPAYMDTRSKGRLGNVMFQYASLLGISCRTGHVPVLDGYSSDMFDRFFYISHLRDLLIKNATTFREKEYGVFDDGTSSLNSSKNWTLNGYFQSWKYFCDIGKEIWQEFTFNDRINRRAFNIIRKFTGKTLVGVHVRRGDMLSKPMKTLGYIVADEHYLHKAMAFFRDIYTNVQFILCSDEIEWCKTMIKSNDVYFVEHNTFEVDLVVLSHCNYSIITSGTFGWWARGWQAAPPFTSGTFRFHKLA